MGRNRNAADGISLRLLPRSAFVVDVSEARRSIRDEWYAGQQPHAGAAGSSPQSLAEAVSGPRLGPAHVEEKPRQCAKEARLRTANTLPAARRTAANVTPAPIPASFQAKPGCEVDASAWLSWPIN